MHGAARLAAPCHQLAQAGELVPIFAHLIPHISHCAVAIGHSCCPSRPAVPALYLSYNASCGFFLSYLPGLPTDPRCRYVSWLPASWWRRAATGSLRGHASGFTGGRGRHRGTRKREASGCVGGCAPCNHSGVVTAGKRVRWYERARMGRGRWRFVSALRADECTGR